MSFLAKIFPARPAPSPGRELAMVRVDRERERIHENMRAMRETFGLAPFTPSKLKHKGNRK